MSPQHSHRLARRGPGSPRPYPVGMRRGACLLADVCCVLAFVALGRAAHHDGEGLASTAWPFLAGLGIGLAAVRGWRRPAAIVPAGLGAWLGTALAGQALRVAAGQGTAPAFIAVALAFLGLFLIGWRAVAWLAGSWRRPSGPG